VLVKLGDKFTKCTFLSYNCGCDILLEQDFVNECHPMIVDKETVKFLIEGHEVQQPTKVDYVEKVKTDLHEQQPPLSV
jgi:hypothetical protein